MCKYNHTQTSPLSVSFLFFHFLSHGPESGSCASSLFAGCVKTRTHWLCPRPLAGPSWNRVGWRCPYVQLQHCSVPRAGYVCPCRDPSELVGWSWWEKWQTGARHGLARQWSGSELHLVFVYLLHQTEVLDRYHKETEIKIKWRDEL